MEVSSINTQCTAIIFIRLLPSTTNFLEAKLSSTCLSHIFWKYSKTLQQQPENIQRLFRLPICLSHESSTISRKYSKTFRPAINSSNSQQLSTAAINSSHQQQQSTAATSSNQQQPPEAINSSHQQQQSTAATSSNQQQPPAATINSSHQQQQSTAVTSSSNQQQQSTSATTSSRPTSSIYTIYDDLR